MSWREVLRRCNSECWPSPNLQRTTSLDIIFLVIYCSHSPLIKAVSPTGLIMHMASHLQLVVFFLISFIILGKGKSVLMHAMKTYGGSEGIAAVMFNLATRWR